ncbi:MAG: trimethylamine methyltransferase family protein, partial [Bacillota bacterium]|nr:trimethylamine methyltransferase family protein [Bacillota bacterium]
MGRNTQAVFNGLGSFGIVGYSQDELQTIHLASLDLLQNVGVRVDSAEAREIFAAGGAVVDPETNIVRIPPYVVEDAIRTAPPTVLLAARDPQKDYVVEKNRVGFVNFGEGVVVRDIETKEYRPSTKADLVKCSIMSDYLSNMDITYRAVASQDIPGPLQALHNAEAIFPNTTKHVFIGPDGAENAKKIIRMASLVAGGRENLRKRPLVTFNVCPTSLLKLIPECTDVVILAAKEGVPINIISMAMAGATSPVTLAGTLV